jgi:hypothetical protein
MEIMNNIWYSGKKCLNSWGLSGILFTRLKESGVKPTIENIM